MGLKLPDESQMDPKKFLLFNIGVIILIPFLSVIATAGAYIFGLILGIILLIALVIALFMFAGPIIAIGVLIIVGIALGGSAAAFNSLGNGVEIVASFVAMAIPAVFCLILGIAMFSNAKKFEDRRVTVTAYLTAVAYLVALVLFIVSGVMMASDGQNGIGANTPFLYGMMVPSVTRLFYLIFGYGELKNR